MKRRIFLREMYSFLRDPVGWLADGPGLRIVSVPDSNTELDKKLALGSKQLVHIAYITHSDLTQISRFRYKGRRNGKSISTVKVRLLPYLTDNVYTLDILLELNKAKRILTGDLSITKNTGKNWMTYVDKGLDGRCNEAYTSMFGVKTTVMNALLNYGNIKKYQNDFLRTRNMLLEFYQNPSAIG